MRENEIIEALCLRKEKVGYFTREKKFQMVCNFVYRAQFCDTISSQSAGSSQTVKKEYCVILTRVLSLI